MVVSGSKASKGTALVAVYQHGKGHQHVEVGTEAVS